MGFYRSAGSISAGMALEARSGGGYGHTSPKAQQISTINKAANLPDGHFGKKIQKKLRRIVLRWQQPGQCLHQLTHHAGKKAICCCAHGHPNRRHRHRSYWQTLIAIALPWPHRADKTK